MSENIETMKRRLQFLVNERAYKLEELKLLEKNSKSLLTEMRAMCSALLGDNADFNLQLSQQQQRNARINDIASQIRTLDFEISNLASEIKRKENNLTKDSQRTSSSDGLHDLEE